MKVAVSENGVEFGLYSLEENNPRLFAGEFKPDDLGTAGRSSGLRLAEIPEINERYDLQETETNYRERVQLILTHSHGSAPVNRRHRTDFLA